MPIALLIGGSSTHSISALEAAIRDGISRVLPDAHIVPFDEAREAGACRAILAADEGDDVAALIRPARLLHESKVPVVWLYPDGCEAALSRFVTASFPLRSRHLAASDAMRAASFMAEAIARVVAIGGGLP